MTEPRFVNGFVDGHDLVLLYRDEAGRLMARRRRAEWSSFYRREHLQGRADVLRELRNSEFVLGISEEGEWVRVKWQAPEWRRKAHDSGGWFEQLGIRHYEADVDAVRRFFSDTGAQVAKPRRIYLDIETDSRVPPALARQGRARVLCWTLVDDQDRVVAAAALKQDDDEAERQLLEAFWQALDPYDQVVAWFGDIFDFPIMKLRSERVGAEFKDPRRWLWCDFAAIYERMNKNAAESGAEKESMSLQAVSMARLGEGKHEFDASKTWEAWAAGGSERQRMVDYCGQDTKLLPKLARKTGFLDVNDAICEVSRLFADTSSANPTEFVDGFMLRLAVERGMHFPSRAPYSKEDQGKHEQFKGAYVMEPKIACAGIVRDIHVADFSGMYPSLILTWNMSPETKVAVNVNGPITEGCCRSPSTRQGFRVGEPGMLVVALKKIRDLRKYWQKKQASLPPGTPEWLEAGRLSTAYKVIANSFYGVVGSPFSRFFDRSIAESVTQNGVWLIQKTIQAAEERGMEAVYTDTDSVFVRGVTREAFAAFVKWCNEELYPKAIAECGCVENFVEIAYEKEFERLVMVAAKKYTAVYRHYKGVASCTCDTPKGEPGAINIHTMTCENCKKTWDALPPPRGKPEIRGLEYKRGDAALLARRLQWDAIQKLLRELCEDPEAFVPMVEAMRRHVLEEPLPVEEVRKSQSLGKPLREYKPKMKNDGTPAAEPPQVQVARILKGRGELVAEGTKIQYFITDGSTSPQKVAPAADYQGECDRFYIWEQMVWPPTERLLTAAFPRAEWHKRFGIARPKKQRKAAAATADLFGNPGSAPRRKRSEADPRQGGLF